MPPVRRGQRRAAFEQFVTESTGGLLRTAYLVTGDAGHTEDLVQETLIKVARRWSRVDRMENPEAYARKILVNLAVDGSNRRSRHRGELAAQQRPDGLAQCDPHASWGVPALVEERMELVRALAELPPRQRAVLVLRFFHDLSESEVASTLGCSIGTVKSTTSRALARMRSLLPNQRSMSSIGFEVLAYTERKAGQG
ncbi:MAG TPA: SigE family RNA polymerase sigma factor [Acidimicrobiales bacterium]|nr:SigE family RNA polymerase sigma factor [Acidimicrobiales bacterium]